MRHQVQLVFRFSIEISYKCVLNDAEVDDNYV